MQNEDKQNQYLPKTEPEKTSIEVPASQFPSTYERIQLRGRAYRNIARGQTPGWILIC